MPETADDVLDLSAYGDPVDEKPDLSQFGELVEGPRRAGPAEFMSGEDIIPFGGRGTTAAPVPITPSAPLSIREQVDQEEAEKARSPVQNFMAGFGQVGEALPAVLADIGTGQSPMQGGAGGNVGAAIEGRKPEYQQTYENIRKEAPALSMAGKTAAAGVATIPKMAGVIASGPAAPLTGAVLFGFDNEGNFHPATAAIAAALPMVSKWGGAGLERIAQVVAGKLGISIDGALGLINAGGSYGTANAVLIGQTLPEWSSMTEEQKQDAVAGIISNSLLGLADFHGAKTPTRERQARVLADQVNRGVRQSQLPEEYFGGTPLSQNIVTGKPAAPRPEIPPRPPETFEKPTTTEKPNASENLEAAEVHGNVRPQSGERAGEVPEPPSGGGVQPQTGGGLPPGEIPQAPRGEVPLSGLEQMLSDPATFKGRNWTRDALQYGASLDPAKPETFEALKALEAKYNAELKEAVKAGDFDAISNAGTKKQWVTEAIQAATGLEGRDAALKEVGEDYEPPFPGGKPRAQESGEAAPVKPEAPEGEPAVTVTPPAQPKPPTETAKEPWQMTKSEYDHDYFKKSTHGYTRSEMESARRRDVEAALKEGKPVPEHVLKELGIIAEPAPPPVEPPKPEAEKASVLVRVKSHRARDRMNSALGDIGTNLQKGMAEGEFYAVTASEYEKIKDIAGISKAKPTGKLGPALFGGEGHDARMVEARRRLNELLGGAKEGGGGARGIGGEIAEDVPLSGGSKGPTVLPGVNPKQPLNAPILTPKAKRVIIAELAKGLKVPIRFGRGFFRALGYYVPKWNLIVSKRPEDILVVSHEVGHRLDEAFGLRTDPTIAAELDHLGENHKTRPGSYSSWRPGKSHDYKLGEGVAEFVRYWLTDPAEAKKLAPNTQAAFERALDANKDFGDTMRTAQADIKTWKEAQPQARLRSQISVGDNPNKTPYTLSQLTRDLVDDLHILRLASEEGAKATGRELQPSQNPYLLARNLRGSYGMAENFIRRGVVDFDTKAVTLGTGLEDALKPVAGRLADFRDWIVAKRAQELVRQGRQTGLIKSDVDVTAQRFDKDPAFQKAFADVKAWQEALLQYTVDAGLISPRAAMLMRRMNQDYVPFHRVYEVGAGEPPSEQSMGVGRGLNVGRPGSLKRMRGSRRQIVDPIETMIKNAYVMVTAAEKQAINRAVAELGNLPGMGKWVERIAEPKEKIMVGLEKLREQLEGAGANLDDVDPDTLLWFFRDSSRVPFGQNVIRVNGADKARYYRLDRELYNTFKALDMEDSGTITKLMAAPAQLLRAGVTQEPSFNIANAIRDTFSAAVISKYGALPFETTVKGMASLFTNPKLVAEWAAAGGKSAVEASYFDRTKMQRMIREHITKDLTPMERAMVVAKSPLTALRWLSGTFEEATRIGEYQIAMKKLLAGGMPEGEARRLAAFEARDRQDFAKGGAKTKWIRHVTAFWNAQLQANVKLAQSFKERPGQTLLRGFAFVTIPKLLEQFVNWDDDDYWKRPQWERDAFFLIPAGKDQSGHTRFIRVPTPFEVGAIFGTLPGRILQWAKTHDPEAAKTFPMMFAKGITPNPIPHWAETIAELAIPKGYDFFRGRQIIPEHMAELPTDLQYTEQTSAIAKKLGKAMGVSPLKVDHAIERSTGGLGKAATGRQIPGRRFITTPLNVSNQPVQDFYDTLETMRKEYGRVKLTGEGDAPEFIGPFEQAAREMGLLRAAARRTTDEKEKREYQEQIFEIAKEVMDQRRKALQERPSK